eukprot:TRINITY_DN237894_c0_g1_i1.p1 TRINITY_DN237894_c0_g1~~TRINITY_DN237894_c0_g1_i1.p1  ORF type:complete len:223 (+),score=23.92 TRINITY_DN237894_c0_g1_i1:68-736(+)
MNRVKKALVVARSAFPSSKCAFPIVLVSHLTNRIDDSALLNKCLDHLVLTSKIRHFVVPNSQFRNEKAIVFMKDISKYFKKILANQKDSTKRNILLLFQKVMVETAEPYIFLEDLEEALNDDKGGIKFLLQSGLLARKNNEEYFFSVPKGSDFFESLMNGRKEIKRLFKMFKFNECNQSVFLKRTLRSSTLGSQFHIQDAIAIHLLRRVETPGGIILKLGNV